MGTIYLPVAHAAAVFTIAYSVNIEKRPLQNWPLLIQLYAYNLIDNVTGVKQPTYSISAIRFCQKMILVALDSDFRQCIFSRMGHFGYLEVHYAIFFYG